ncbi:unnamed protein product [Mesocestoides corti]|uniref:Uncharacterized protein n=2 Tax=Mesocestoides corti TaxID=53468 RepID=A0A0R3UCI5_MESCO|nr:unnamed protein product [Mesocestoides corti]
MLPRNYCFQKYLQEGCRSGEDSGFQSPGPAARTDAAIPASSTMATFPPCGSYGIFRLDEDMAHFSARSDCKSPDEAAHQSSQSCSGSSQSLNQITLPTVLVEGFRDGKIQLNVPGVLQDLFSPPDSINVQFNIGTPIEELSDMDISDYQHLLHAAEVIHRWKWKQYAGESPTPR